MTTTTHTVALDAATEQPRAGAREWAALAVLMLPVLMVSVDNTVLSFALPAISVDLRPSGNQLLWIVDLYAIMLAGLLIAMGSLGDRVGRRRLLLIGSVGFGAASLLAAYSTSAEMLLIARMLLGVFGATLMPSTLSLIRNVFTHSGTAVSPSPPGPPCSPAVLRWAPSWVAGCWSTSGGARSS